MTTPEGDREPERGKILPLSMVDMSKLPLMPLEPRRPPTLWQLFRLGWRRFIPRLDPPQEAELR